MVLSKYCTVYPHSEKPDSVILFSTKRASSVLLPKSMLADIKDGNISAEEEALLLRLGLLAKDEQAEREEMLGFVDAAHAGNKRLHITLVMNMDCNLDCKYCFEGTRKGRAFMTGEIADRLIDFIKNSDLYGKEELRISFYGGEPLLSADLISYISENIKSFIEDNGLIFGAALITNGTLLTPKVVERLTPFGLKGAKITLDGPADVHDLYRPFKSGKGSFNQIFKNLVDVCDSLRVMVGGNYTKTHYREFPRLLDCLLESGIFPDRIAGVKFDPVVQESGDFAMPEFNDGCLSMNEPWRIRAALFLREEILKRGFFTPPVAPSICATEGDSSMVVSHEGEIYKCPGMLGRQGLCIGNMRTGVKDCRSAYNLDNWKNEQCLNCAYLPLCFGGCRYANVIRNGSLEGVECKKNYLDATLETFVKQDLKYRKQKAG